MTREAQIRQTASEWLRYYHPTCTQDMLHAAFVCGAQWADEHPQNPWISVNDHLPPIDSDEVSGDVIVKTKDGHWYQAWYDYEIQEWLNAGRGACKYIEDVTHWMDPKELK